MTIEASGAAKNPALTGKIQLPPTACSHSGFRRLFRCLTREVDHPLDEQVRAGAHPKRPVSTEPAAGVLIRGRRPHHARQERVAFIDGANRQGVDRLCITGVLELAKRVGCHPRKLNDRSPELAHETQGDFVLRTLIQQDPAVVPEERGRVA